MYMGAQTSLILTLFQLRGDRREDDGHGPWAATGEHSNTPRPSRNHQTTHTKIDKIKMDIYVIFLILIGYTEMVSVISKPFISTNELNLAF